MNPGILTPPTQYATMPRGLLGRPTPVPMIDPQAGYHPEAQDWLLRVQANGGSVSAATFRAVNRFCSDIDAAGVRDRLLRLNLLCGGNLAAALVPLYRGPSIAATQLGSATDTNVNFVAADYIEAGSTGGLKGNGTTKYLNTGFNARNDIPSSNDSHHSYSATSVELSGNISVSGSFSGDGAGGLFGSSAWDAYVGGRRLYRIGPTASGNSPFELSPTSVVTHYIASRLSNVRLTGYSAGVTQGSVTSAASPLFFNGNLFVFALNNAGTAAFYSACRLRMYSFGNGLTDAQSLSFSAAVTAFNNALGRT